MPYICTQLALICIVTIFIGIYIYLHGHLHLSIFFSLTSYTGEKQKGHQLNQYQQWPLHTIYIVHLYLINRRQMKNCAACRIHLPVLSACASAMAAAS